MNENMITPADLAGKGVVGLPDVPGLSAQDMQRKLDELALDVLAPKHNALIDALASADGAQAIGSGTTTVAGHIADTANPHAVTAAQVGAYTKGETDAAISGRIQDIGSADMTKAVYDIDADGIVDDAQRLGGLPPTHYAAAADAFSNHTHTCVDGVHRLTGSGDNIKFTATAAFCDGDTFTVNGAPCAAQTADGEPAADGLFAEGAVVSCFKNGDCLNFKTGGASACYRVVAVADIAQLPDAARDNDIAVVTECPLAGAVFASELPAGEPTEGTVFFQTGRQSATALDVQKNDTLMVYPYCCRQYDDGQWCVKNAYVRVGGQWTQMGQFFLEGADLYNGVTGGYAIIAQLSGAYATAQITQDGILFAVTSSIIRNMGSNLAVDVTGLRTVYFQYDVPAAGVGNRTVSFGLHPARSCVYTTGAQGWAVEFCRGNDSAASDNIVALDVSGLSGVHYILMTLTASSGASQNMLVKKIWGE